MFSGIKYSHGQSYAARGISFAAPTLVRAVRTRWMLIFVTLPQAAASDAARKARC